jgi:hypothetical protein
MRSQVGPVPPVRLDDVLIVTELSRLGRSILEVMSILHRNMEIEAKVFTTNTGRKPRHKKVSCEERTSRATRCIVLTQ